MNRAYRASGAGSAVATAAKRVALVAEPWLPFSASGQSRGPIFVRVALECSSPGGELARYLDVGLRRTLARARRAAARQGADRVVGFHIDVDPFGSRIEFSASGIAVCSSEGPPPSSRSFDWIAIG